MSTYEPTSTVQLLQPAATKIYIKCGNCGRIIPTDEIRFCTRRVLTTAGAPGHEY